MIVLLTGVTGGLGGVLGSMLVDEGFTVYGTSRNPDAHEGEYPFPLLKMDLSDEDSVAAAVAELVAKEGRIDVSINCANEMIIGSVLEASMADVEQLYDTNVFGLMRLCRQVAPVMIGQGGGSIINMSSAGGLIAVPFMSSYTSSKFALEAFTEAFRHEMMEHNVSVTLIQPVAMHMDRPDTGSHLRLVDGVTEGSVSQRMLGRMSKDTKNSKLTPEMVSKKIIEVIRMPDKPVKVAMDKAKVIGTIKRFAPQSLLDKMVRGLVGLDRPAA